MKMPHPVIEQKLKALGSQPRLAILSYLLQHKTGTVTDLAKAAGIRIETTSQHLRILKSAGIVESARRGRYVAYRLSLHQEKMVRGVLDAV